MARETGTDIEEGPGKERDTERVAGRDRQRESTVQRDKERHTENVDMRRDTHGNRGILYKHRQK